jgi:hypothetical protein
MDILVQHHIIDHFQCVNDTFIVYLQIATDIQEFLNIINNLTLKMPYTMEEEYENTIGFLDVTIS